MRILILNGSPRPKGNTKQMVDAFRSGAESAGHRVDVIDVCRKKIAGCLACEYCHTRGNGACVQKDDMQEVYSLLWEADMLVIASPIYYHGVSGQLKCALDRFYSVILQCMMAQCSHTKGIFWNTLALKIWGCLQLTAWRTVRLQS